MNREACAVLMCAGEYESMEIPFQEGDLKVAVDGGLVRLLDQGICPDLVLGDFDSLDEKYRPYLEKLESETPEKILKLPCEKDDTDTLYAARVCLEKGYREIIMYGGLGGRLDHTISNLQTLAWIRRQGGRGYLLGRREKRTVLVTALCGEQILFPMDYAGMFSLFALDSLVTGVTLEGMKYPLGEAELTNDFPLGVSNEIRPSGRRARAAVREGMALMILETEPGREMIPSMLERAELS